MNAGISSVHVLEVDPHTHSMMQTYAEGLTVDDVTRMVRAGILPEETVESFRFQHARFQNSVMSKAGEAISRITGDKRYFRPHPGNVIYNPITDQWTIIDAR